MRSAAVTAAALAAFLASGRVGHAAYTARLDLFPRLPRAGQTATIQLRPFRTLGERGRPPAVFPKRFPWAVATISPSGRRLSVRVARRADNPYVWTGTVRFPSGGLWTLCILNFSSTGRACIPRSPGWQRVRVWPRNERVDVWQRLERPFHIPTLASGGVCPTTASDSKGDLSRIPGFVGTAWGEGPAYPSAPDSAAGKPTLRYLDPIPRESIFYGSAWSGSKVLWIVDSTYLGPVLVRGLQLDGPNELRFEFGTLPSRAMRILPVAAPRARDRPSFTRVRGPGCYAYQVDGLGFSYAIVFEAKPM